MDIYNIPFPKLDTTTVIALGTFDGVHIGHKAVIGEAVNTAKTLGVSSLVWCFTKPPHREDMLTEPDEKARLIEALGVDILIMTPRASDLLALDPDEFTDALTEHLRPAHIVVGYNYTYGKNAAGNTDTLRAYLAPRGIGLTVIPPVRAVGADGAPVSSSAIRRMLACGDTAAASRLLGRKIPPAPMSSQ